MKVNRLLFLFFIFISFFDCTAISEENKLNKISDPKQVCVQLLTFNKLEKDAVISRRQAYKKFNEDQKVPGGGDLESIRTASQRVEWITIRQEEIFDQLLKMAGMPNVDKNRRILNGFDSTKDQREISFRSLIIEGGIVAETFCKGYGVEIWDYRQVQ